MKYDVFEPRFVDSMPMELEQGVLYVCIRYRTSAHLCACGCGNRVTSPIRPPRWHLTYDGEGVTLWPSVGSWQFPCRSHYWIKRNKVVWASPWTDKQIEMGRERDAEDMRLYYAPELVIGQEMATPSEPPRPSFLRGLYKRIRG